MIGAGLTACSFFSHRAEFSQLEVKQDSEQSNSNPLESVIKVYRDSLNEEMSKIIAENEVLLIREKPCSALHNWVADAVHKAATDRMDLDAPAMTLLNHGGIRSSVEKGQVSIGDMFELMPFDNTLTYLKLPSSYRDSVFLYIKATGGEPISNAQIENNSLEISGLKNQSHFWLITNDYLANGGDNMRFALGIMDKIQSEKLIRDIYIEAAEKQGVLKIDSVCRVNL